MKIKKFKSLGKLAVMGFLSVGLATTVSAAVKPSTDLTETVQAVSEVQAITMDNKPIYFLDTPLTTANTKVLYEGTLTGNGTLEKTLSSISGNENEWLCLAVANYGQTPIYCEDIDTLVQHETGQKCLGLKDCPYGGCHEGSAYRYVNNVNQVEFFDLGGSKLYPKQVLDYTVKLSSPYNQPIHAEIKVLQVTVDPSIDF